MDKRVVSVLAAIVVGLAGYLFFFERGQLTSKQVDDRKGRALDTFVRDRVDELSLTHAGVTLRFERSPAQNGELGPFRMTAPRSEEADESAIDSLVGELEWLSARRTIDAPSAADLTTFGLDKPAYTLVYCVAGARHTFVVGKSDVHGDSYYARLDDAPRVLLVPKTAVEALDKAPGHFRTKQFLGDIVSTWARKLTVESAGVSVTVEKENGRFWVADAPRSFADDTRVREVVKALDALRATRYVEGEVLTRVHVPSLVPVSALTLKIVPDDAREDQQPAAFALIVYGACPEHADERLARAGAAGDFVCVLSDDVRPLLDLGDLREHHMLPADPSEITRLQFAGPGARFELKRKDDSWEDAKGGAVDSAAVEAWLAELRRLHGSYGGAHAFAAGAHTLVLTLAGDQRVSLTFDTLPDDELAVTREGEGLRVVFGGYAKALLAAEAGRFRSLAPWEAHKPSEVTALSARVQATSRSLTLVDGTFRSGPRATPVADSLRVRELIRELIKWRALAYIGDGSSAPAFVTPFASVVLTLSDKSTLALEVGPRDADSVYVRTAEHALFRAEPTLLAQLYELAGAPVPADLVPAPAAPEDADDDELSPGHDEAHDEHDEAH